MCPITTAAWIFTVWCNSATRLIVLKSRPSPKDFTLGATCNSSRKRCLEVDTVSIDFDIPG